MINGIEKLSQVSQPYLCTEGCFTLFFLQMSHLSLTLPVGISRTRLKWWHKSTFVPNIGALILLTSCFKTGFKCLFHLPSYHWVPMPVKSKVACTILLWTCFSFEGYIAGKNTWSQSCKLACRKIEGRVSVAATRPLADTVPIPRKSCLSQHVRTVAAGKLLNVFVTVGGFQLLLERNHTARAGILLNSSRAAPLAGEGMESSAFQYLLGFLFGFSFPS